MNATPINPWHCLTANAALKHAESRLDDGLSDDSARRRPAEFGKNQLVAEPTRTALKILLAQWQSSLVVLLLMTACLCNDAQTQADADCKSTPPTVIGEPTEQALVEVANDFGFQQLELQRAFPRVDECPFDSDRKRMSTLHAVKPAAAESLGIVPQPLLDARRVAFIQGAIDSVLSVSISVWTDGETAALNDEHRQRIARTRDELAATGARV